MIKRINKLKNFGIFHNFLWQTDTPEFKRFNLIYGWNYSGKTTLSRVFRCFELKQLHDNYGDATFEVVFQDGSKYDQLHLTQSFAVRVFNSDYVDDNLKWKEGINPVLLVGRENIKLEQQLKEAKANLEKQRERIKELSRTVRKEEGKIETGLTDKAREIKNTLALPTYDKRKFEPTVISVASTPEANILSEEQVQQYLQTYRSIDKKDTIPEITLLTSNMPDLCKQTETILQKTATASIIERLKENPSLEKWVRDGKELHENKKKCEFCGGLLPDDLLNKLNAHFSDEYNRLMTQIDQFAIILEGAKVSTKLHDKARFYPKLYKNYEQSKKNLESTINVFNETIEELLNKLKIKKTKPFESITFIIPQDSTDQLNTEMDVVNNIIQRHNSKTDKFETEKNTAKEKLVKHWASEFAIRMKYSETLKIIKEKETDIENITEVNDKTLGKISEIEQQLSDAVKGAGKINEYLNSYFGTNEIRMTVAEDDKYFKLERFGHNADNLSEGEKTAIAFSHFMATLEDKNTTLADTIVFIDDPVSSLDCNHLFHTYAFIKSRLVDCKQLFISTHNFEFFNLIKEWFISRKKMDRNNSFYLIEKTENGENAPFKANLKELPSPLSKFRSEYVYLFSLLYKFNETPIMDYDYLYILPNLVRRYLEAYVGFRALGGLGSNLSILIDDKTQQEKVYKFINTFSHTSSSPRLLHFPDFGECKDVVDVVLKTVQKKDRNHYDALVDKCN